VAVEVEHGVRLDGNAMSVIRWMCGFPQSENTDLRELLGLEAVSIVIMRNRLSWFGASWMK